MARVAVLDANVLWPQYLRDVLIRAGVSGLYRPVWTDQILEEMRRSLLRANRVGPGQIDRTVRLMREGLPEFRFDSNADLISVMTNDQKDRHVLAAAVCAGADTIVTENTKDFPLASREQYGIDLHTPDQFLIDLWLTDARRMAHTLVSMAEGLKDPPMTVQVLVQRIGRHAPHFASAILPSGDLETALKAAKIGVPLPAYRLR